MCTFLQSQDISRYINTYLKSCSPQYIYWHIGYILLKKLLLGAAKVIFIISELSTVESHHWILNRSFVFVIIKENWWGKEASEESILGFKTGFQSMPRACMMTLFHEGCTFHIALQDCQMGQIPWPSVREVGPSSETGYRQAWPLAFPKGGQQPWRGWDTAVEQGCRPHKD